MFNLFWSCICLFLSYWINWLQFPFLSAIPPYTCCLFSTSVWFFNGNEPIHHLVRFSLVSKAFLPLFVLVNAWTNLNQLTWLLFWKRLLIRGRMLFCCSKKCFQFVCDSDERFSQWKRLLICSKGRGEGSEGTSVQGSIYLNHLFISERTPSANSIVSTRARSLASVSRALGEEALEDFLTSEIPTRAGQGYEREGALPVKALILSLSSIGG